jgi:prepilin-type processing-associated H-X9-DG protein
MTAGKGSRYLSRERIDVGLRSEPDKACRRVTGLLEAGFYTGGGGRVNALFADGQVVSDLLRTRFRKTRCAIGVAARYSPSAQGC